MAEKKPEKQQLVAASKMIFGYHPEDVLCVVRQGESAIDWMGELFELIEQGAPPHRIRKLAQIGRHIAMDQQNYLETMREAMILAAVDCGVIDPDIAAKLNAP